MNRGIISDDAQYQMFPTWNNNPNVIYYSNDYGQTWNLVNGSTTSITSSFLEATRFFEIIILSHRSGSTTIRYKKEIKPPKGDKGDSIVGPPGASIKGDPGASIIWRGVYNNSTQYYLRDAVSYTINGNTSSHMCIQNSLGNIPTNINFWNLMAAGVQGPQGESIRGEKGDSGLDSFLDIVFGGASIIASLGTLAVVNSRLSVLEASMATNTANDLLSDGRISILETKTQNQNGVVGSTIFTGNLNVSNGISNTINLNGTSGNISCNNINNTNDIETQNMNVNNNLNVSEDIICQDNIFCNSIKPLTSDVTQAINIGNISQLDSIVLNGFVTMPLMQNSLGFNVSNGFINQF